MKACVVICGLLLMCVAAACQEVQQQCGDHPHLLRDRSGQVKWFTSDELRRMATKTVAPEPASLPGFKYTGFVTVKLMVDTAGDIVCLWGAAGNPVMIPPAVQAVHKWKFKPLVVEGQKSEFLGRLKVSVSSK